MTGSGDGDIYQCLMNGKAIRMAAPLVRYGLGSSSAQSRKGAVASRQVHQACPQPVVLPLAHVPQSSSRTPRMTAVTGACWPVIYQLSL